ncbi:hypothetical protein ACEWY4_015540 [Coilia grayii]|uniref:Uncharacterized protein n=1 Tax=Coilia grayii TaxID=363190 RepID=A0ABD1JPT5_9TELE
MLTQMTLLLLLLLFPCSYEECVGPGATQIYIPTDDPPPYSLTDPCQAACREDRPDPHDPHTYLDMEGEGLSAGGDRGGASWVAAGGGASHYPVGLYELHRQPIASISLSTLPMEEAPPYEVVVGGGTNQNQPIPLIPMDLLKHSGEESRDSPQHTPVSQRIL